MQGLLIAFVTFFVMEGITWCTHKFVMHGFLWNLHEDHHNRKMDSFFEKNDYFFVIFAIPSIIGFALGTYLASLWYLFYVSLGVAMYGLAYFIIHDIVIHQRFRLFTRIDNFYFRAIRKAHKIHHKHLGKEQGECFGMLWVPVKYFKEALNSSK